MTGAATLLLIMAILACTFIAYGAGALLLMLLLAVTVFIATACLAQAD